MATLTEQALRHDSGGDASPYWLQRLLSGCIWDADLVWNDLRQYVVEHLRDSDTVLVVDETGFIKKGEESVGGAAPAQPNDAVCRELSSWRVPVLCLVKGQDAAGPGAVPAPGVD